MLPNFLIVGASQSGTTSLWHHLGAHPAIFMPKRKESRFFSDIKVRSRRGHHIETTLIKTLKAYKRLFRDVKNENAIGDNSPDYLPCYQKSVKNIIGILGKEVKIIIILRNPVERAYTLYLKYINKEYPSLSFEDALQKGGQYGVKEWYGYYPLESGLYYKQVKAFLDSFNNVRIYLTDELQTKPESVMKDLYEFLEVDHSFKSNFKARYNSYPGRVTLLYSFYLRVNAKFQVIAKLFSLMKFLVPARLKKIILLNPKKPKMKAQTRNYLKNYYREDIIKLEKLIRKDLSMWRK